MGWTCDRRRVLSAGSWTPSYEFPTAKVWEEDGRARSRFVLEWRIGGQWGIQICDVAKGLQIL